jgi:hypothetical protein
MISKKILGLVMGLMILGMGLPLISQATTVSPVKLELEAQKGQTLNQTIKLRNDAKDPVTYYLSAEQFIAADESGKPQFVGGNKADLASWIKFNYDSITVLGGQTIEVPFTIAVPEFAGPGGHYAAIFFNIAAPKSAATTSQVSLDNRAGVLVLLKVAGDIKESAELVEFKPADQIYSSLPVDFSFRLKNTGNVHLKPQGTIIISDMFGLVVDKVAVNEAGSNILTDQIRKFDIFWTKNDQVKVAADFWGEFKQESANFALGKYTADLSLTYGTTGTLSATASFWVIPWHVILVYSAAGLITLIILAAIFILIKKYGSKRTLKNKKRVKWVNR